MILPKPHRLSNQLASACCRAATTIVDEDAVVGHVNDCPGCGSSFINDNGVWRNTYSMDKRKVSKLLGLARVYRVTEGIA